MLPQAATEYRAMAFDRPGFGYSAPAPWGYTLADQARALNAGFNALGIESPILVGHSRGGSLVLAYAQLYPDEVGGVVDLAGRPYPAGTSVPLHFRALAKPVLGPVVAHTVAVPFGRPGVISGLNLAFEPEGAPPPAYLDAYMAMALRPQHLLAFAQDITGARTALRRLAPEYASMDVPLVMVHGTEDRNVSVAQSRRLAQEAPDATLIEVPGAGHELMFWHPDAVMQAIDMLAR
jgi:pimeloyl-ACP methyl ester carboxylesterase